jgi:hypothetical protein
MIGLGLEEPLPNQAVIDELYVLLPPLPTIAGSSRSSF